MGIGSLIREKKQQFFAAKYERDKSKIMKQTESLKAVQQRELELEKANKEKEKVAKEVARLRDYNKKVQGPGSSAKFVKGLQKAVNKGRAALREQQKKTGGINFGGGSNPFSRSGKSNNAFGSVGRNVFSGGSSKTATKPRKKTVKIIKYE